MSRPMTYPMGRMVVGDVETMPATEKVGQNVHPGMSHNIRYDTANAFGVVL